MRRLPCRELWSRRERGRISFEPVSLPLNSRGRSRVLGVSSYQRGYGDRAASPVPLPGFRPISRCSSAARSIEPTTTSPIARTPRRSELEYAALLFAMRANVSAAGPLAHGSCDGDGHARPTVRLINVGSYSGSARLVAAQQVGEECQEQTLHQSHHHRTQLSECWPCSIGCSMLTRGSKAGINPLE
jgi:hypothetical protein